MSYSIFGETMADMTYQQIEQAAQEKQLVLFPIAVMEEHGPHLPLGTDTYLTYQFARGVRNALLESGFHSLIVPPYYWGINACTDGFAGSFTVKPETMISVLCDSLECLKSWGFEHIFLLNLHGDLKHTLTILGAVKKAYEELHVGAYFVIPEFSLERAGPHQVKPYLVIPPTKPLPFKSQPGPPYADIHAGGFETSLMLNAFPELVDADRARTLSSSRTTFADLETWARGGARARELTPLGYCGNPSNIDLEAATESDKRMTEDFAGAISHFLRQKQ